MKRKSLLLSVLFLFLTACTRPVGGVAPTALPVDFPSPAPGSTPLCQPTDLDVSSNSIGATGALMIGVTLTNKSKNPCALANPAQITLLDSDNKLLEVKTSNSPADPAGDPAGERGASRGASSQTPIPSAQMELHAGESAILTLVWRNYCQPLSKDQLTVRVELTEKKNLDVPMQLLSEPPCDAKNEPSTLMVGPYSYPP